MNWAGALCAVDASPGDWLAKAQRPVVRAVRVCRRCPLVEACRVAGESEAFGVWGGVPRGPEQVAALEGVRASQARANRRRYAGESVEDRRARLARSRDAARQRRARGKGRAI